MDDFGELVGIDVNGFALTLKRHRSGKYYEVKGRCSDDEGSCGI